LEPFGAKARSALESFGSLGIDTKKKKMFGTKSEVDPISHLVGTAVGWGGSPPSAAVYEGTTPTLNDGKTTYKLTVKDVVVDGITGGFITPSGGRRWD
jgi:hypothetical protein